MHKNPKKIFGARLKMARQAAGWSSAERFARAHGIYPGTYRFWEAGETMPRPLTLVNLARKLKQPVNYFLEGLDNQDIAS